MGCEDRMRMGRHNKTSAVEAFEALKQIWQTWQTWVRDQGAGLGAFLNPRGLLARARGLLRRVWFQWLGSCISRLQKERALEPDQYVVPSFTSTGGTFLRFCLAAIRRRGIAR